jgi:putative membrane protein
VRSPAWLLATSGGPASPYGSPWSPHVHPVTIGVVVALAVAYLLSARSDARPSAKQRWQFGFGVAALLVAGSWPLEDLAAHWSLTALVVQRLLLVLVAAPALLFSIPATLAARLTKPRVIDSGLAFVSKPVVAVAIFTTVAVGTLLTPAVAAQSSNAAARTGLDALLMLSGMVLWSPVTRGLPGSSRPTPVGRAVYLFVQSIVPGFPSVVFVFARHPLYPAFSRVHDALRLSPLVDQQLAGIVAKVATLPVLWTAAWYALSEAQRRDREGIDTETLTWAEVQRQLERAERAERALSRRSRDSGGISFSDLPPPGPRPDLPPFAEDQSDQPPTE